MWAGNWDGQDITWKIIFTDNCPGQDWWYGFLRCHPKCISSPEQLETAWSWVITKDTFLIHVPWGSYNKSLGTGNFEFIETIGKCPCVPAQQTSFEWTGTNNAGPDNIPAELASYLQWSLTNFRKSVANLEKAVSFTHVWTDSVQTFVPFVLRLCSLLLYWSGPLVSLAVRCHTTFSQPWPYC